MIHLVWLCDAIHSRSLFCVSPSISVLFPVFLEGHRRIKVNKFVDLTWQLLELEVI